MADLREIVRRHGGDLYAGGQRATIPGPGHSPKDRSLSLRVVDNGRLLWDTFADRGSLTHRAVMEYLGLSADEGRQATPAEIARERARRERERREESARDLRFCADVWSETLPLPGTPAEAYLWGRGLVFDGIQDVRYHPNAPRGKEPGAHRHPAMVALVRTAEGKPCALHVTFIAADGTGKAFGQRSRLMFGPTRGHSLQMEPPRQGVLAVAEGIETAAGFSALHGVPTWSALSAPGLSTFVVPRRVRKLIIAADGDAAGMNAALALASRARKLCDVEIEPAADGRDWADAWEAANG